MNENLIKQKARNSQQAKKKSRNPQQAKKQKLGRRIIAIILPFVLTVRDNVMIPKFFSSSYLFN